MSNAYHYGSRLVELIIVIKLKEYKGNAVELIGEISPFVILKMIDGSLVLGSLTLQRNIFVSSVCQLYSSVFCIISLLQENHYDMSKAEHMKSLMKPVMKLLRYLVTGSDENTNCNNVNNWNLLV